MNTNKIRIGITEGDINGIGYEVILKAFGTSEIFDLCVPIIYGSPKVATYHSKAINSTTNFSIVRSALEAKDGCLNVINCNSNEVVVALGTPDPLAGVAAFEALECAVEDYKQGLIDVIVTAPINKHSIQSDQFSFVGHTEYFENRLGNGAKALMILLKDDFRIALVTTHIPISRISSVLTKELIEEKLTIFNTSLKQDFSIDAPRIAVLSLNPHAGEDGLIGKEEQDIIIPALVEMKDKGVLCYGPYPVDGFMGSGQFKHFDGILAMYHDQGLGPFKLMAMDEGVNYTAGLPVVRTSPDHGTAYDIVGKGVASEVSFRNAVYTAIDVFRNRVLEKEAHTNPLRKQYFDKRDDSDKLKLDSVDNED